MSFAVVPSAGGATPVIVGAFGTDGPVVAVIVVLLADHALVPAAFELST